jgi:hypothetical protein
MRKHDLEILLVPVCKYRIIIMFVMKPGGGRASLLPRPPFCKPSSEDVTGDGSGGDKDDGEGKAHSSVVVT